MPEPRILIVEDDMLVGLHLQDTLGAADWPSTLCRTAAEARAILKREVYPVCLLDLRLPDGDGVQMLVEWRLAQPEMAVIILTAHGDIPTAVECLKAGAWDFLTKPLEPHLLVKAVSQAVAQSRLSRRADLLARLQSGVGPADGGIVAVSASMRRSLATAEQVASADFTSVLITGESGTGKGLLARHIHRSGRRAGQPFVEVNCSALPPELWESEFFGHKKGAFTDAKADKPGLFELADGGILFLDEIGDMQLALQTKLLKVIEDQCFRRVGSTTDLRVNVAIIAATNRDLGARTESGHFREDLLYRLNVIPLEVPSLRERPDDVEPMAMAFLHQYATKLGKPLVGFTRQALAALRDYGWPGNVRELRNVVERGCILTRANLVDAEHLLLPAAGPVAHAQPSTEDASASAVSVVPGGLPAMPLAEAEHQVIVAALREAEGNKKMAAEILGIHRSTLYKKLALYGIAD